MSDSKNDILVYRIIDNGCYLHTVEINLESKSIVVYSPNKNIEDGMQEELSSYTDLVFQSNYVNIFIGKSPTKFSMTVLENCRYQGEYNQYYEGNTILIQTSGCDCGSGSGGGSGSDCGCENEYTFIGGSIFSFKSITKIVYYLSIVGYNETPLPYALDLNNNIYLLSYGMMLKLSENMFKKITDYSSLNQLFMNSNNDEVKKRFLIDYVKLL
jgi:hypothetical protein